jgi:hypothetical protein
MAEGISLGKTTSTAAILVSTILMQEERQVSRVL